MERKDLKNRFENIGLELLIAIPGAGKTLYAKQLNNDNINIVCPDNIRKEVTGSISDISQDSIVWKIVFERICKGLNDNKYIILDATNVNTKYRRKLIKNIKETLNNKNFPIYYKLFDCDPEISKQRIKNDILNGVDRSNVPDEVIDNMFVNYLVTLEMIEDEGMIKI